MKTNGKKLINTNPYLKNRRERLKMFIRDTIVSSGIEGIYCKNLLLRSKQLAALNPKTR